MSDQGIVSVISHAVDQTNLVHTNHANPEEGNISKEENTRTSTSSKYENTNTYVAS